MVVYKTAMVKNRLKNISPRITNEISQVVRVYNK